MYLADVLVSPFPWLYYMLCSRMDGLSPSLFSEFPEYIASVICFTPLCSVQCSLWLFHVSFFSLDRKHNRDNPQSCILGSFSFHNKTLKGVTKDGSLDSTVKVCPGDGHLQRCPENQDRLFSQITVISNKTVTVESGTSIEEKADLGGQVGREEEEFTQNMRHIGTCLQVSPWQQPLAFIEHYRLPGTWIFSFI